MPLTFVEDGNLVEVKNIVGGHRVCKRLMEMGLNKGSAIKMIRNGTGAIIIAIGEKRVAIGRGMAMKVMVL